MQGPVGVGLPTFITVLSTFLVLILGGMFKMTRWFISRFASRLDRIHEEFLQELSSLQRDLRNELESLSKEVRCLKKEFNALARALPEKYVFRESFLKDVDGLKLTVDSMRRDISTLGEKLAGATQRISNLEQVSTE